VLLAVASRIEIQCLTVTLWRSRR